MVLFAIIMRVYVCVCVCVGLCVCVFLRSFPDCHLFFNELQWVPEEVETDTIQHLMPISACDVT